MTRRIPCPTRLVGVTALTVLVTATVAVSGCGLRPAVGDDDATPAEATAGLASGAGSVDVAAPDAGDPRRAEQWGLDLVQIDAAWTVSTGADTVIAIVDTGVDGTHPDLQGRLVPGIDFIDEGTGGAVDPNGHGTHVAGIAAAATGNGVGMAGAARGASIMPVRVLEAAGSGADDDIAAGIDWAVDNGADVINLSLGEAGFVARLSKNGPLNAAIRRADEAGVVVVAAAGNDGARRQSYRVGVPVIVVNAVAVDGTAAAFSNTGDVRAVAAPGVGILSTVPVGPSTLFPEGGDGYGLLDGTSMAAPLVAGIAALLVAQGLTPDEVGARITETAVNPTADPALGSGVVDAAAAVGAAAVASSGSAPAPAPTPETEAAPAAPPVPGTRPAPTATPPAVIVPAGPDTITVALTAPAGLDVTVATDVRCTFGGRGYSAAIASAVVGSGYQIGAEVSVLRYRGPGTYPAVAVVEVTAQGTSTAVPLTVDATIDDAGGTVPLAVTSESGITLAGSLTWRCGA